MRVRSILVTVAAAAVTFSPIVAVAAEKVPPALAAKRAGDAPPPPAIPAPQELLYVPITTCRAVNFSMPKQQTRTFQITGSSNMTAQGGPASGCGVPAAAKSVSLKLTADSSSTGYISAVAAGSTTPASIYLAYMAGVLESENAVMPLSAAGQISLYSRWPAEATVDVIGYFVPQLWAYISTSGSIIDSSGRLVSSVKTGTGTYTLTFDRDVGICSGTASSDLSGYIISVYTSGTVAYVYIYNNAGAASDYWFNIHLKC